MHTTNFKVRSFLISLVLFSIFVDVSSANWPGETASVIAAPAGKIRPATQNPGLKIFKTRSGKMAVSVAALLRFKKTGNALWDQLKTKQDFANADGTMNIKRLDQISKELLIVSDLDTRASLQAENIQVSPLVQEDLREAVAQINHARTTFEDMFRSNTGAFNDANLGYVKKWWNLGYTKLEQTLGEISTKR